jgi:hypothetical protein
LGDKAPAIVASLRKLVNEETLVRPEIAKITAKVPEINKDKEVKLSSPPNYDGKKEIATRLAHGTALEKLGKSCEYVIALDGDTKNSTYSIKFHVSYSLFYSILTKKETTIFVSNRMHIPNDLLNVTLLNKIWLLLQLVLPLVNDTHVLFIHLPLFLCVLLIKYVWEQYHLHK